MSESVRENSAHDRFEIVVDGDVAGHLEMVRGDGTVTIPYVEIDPRYGGRGLGSRLVLEAAARLSASGLAVRPLCSFAATVLRDRPDLTRPGAA